MTIHTRHPVGAQHFSINSSASRVRSTKASYDYLDRMTQYRSFVTNGSTATRDDAADYEYDALDRVAEQTESHGATGSPRTTLLSYLGLGSAVSNETQHNGDDGSDPLLTTKSYSYDAYGHRSGLTNAPTGGTAATSTYGYDVHGSVSLLLGDTGTASASYGYRPYGAADAELTKGDLNADNPLNAFRYAAKRLDSGSGSIDMGARRFGPDTARFLQRDAFNGATADLGLALDPLTQNRYALASGNPISFVEWDGHVALLDGGGGGVDIDDPAPEPDESPTEDATDLQGPFYRERGVEPATTTFDFPRRPGFGTLEIDLFISEGATPEIPGILPEFEGDDRGFDPQADPYRSRAYIRLTLRLDKASCK